MREHKYCVYIVASRSRVLYIGVTNNLERRICEHRTSAIQGFTSRYRCHRLVWFEPYVTVTLAIAREKQLKNWSRTKKIQLIEQQNPTWVDLSADWGKEAGPSTGASPPATMPSLGMTKS
jgi:putative endonuclease